MNSAHTRTTLYRHQRGAVSLFIVIFTALLLSTITISFMQFMVSDQRQAMDTDLSESAYDSAVAGVEDAKRLLLLDLECRNGTAAAAVDCGTISTALTPRPGESETECDTLVNAGIVEKIANETPLQQHVGDNAAELDQAYTCVKISPNTDDVIGTFSSANTMSLIPLRSVDDFDSIVISWNQSENGGEVDLPATSDRALPIIDEATWPINRPSLLRAQLINGGGHSSFTLSQFDRSGYSNTLFLYPSSIGSDSLSFALDSRTRSSEASNRPELARCQSNVASGAYACRVKLQTLSTISAGSETVFLGLAAFYNPTSYKIELMNGENIVSFANVQPQVDSTGRANDLFRRVVSRVELGNTFNYPVAALETSGNLCKNFSVTTEESDYDFECTP